jgi:hypothetical protein
MKYDISSLSEISDLHEILEAQVSYWSNQNARLKDEFPTSTAQLNATYDEMFERLAEIESLAARAKNALVHVMTSELVSRDKAAYDDLYGLQMKLFHLRDSLVAVQDEWSDTNWDWFMSSYDDVRDMLEKTT